MKKKELLLFILLISLFSGNIAAQQTDKMEWWRDAKFGLFLHWGIYSHIAGEWKGKGGYNEFVMLTARIPIKEYETVAATLNPYNFNAEHWVLAAKKAGMKYIVYTSKHHEGFAMYHSKNSRYNIYDFTPFKRDPLKELEIACRKHGVKLGIYYSLGRDWHDPDVPTNWPVKAGRSNSWDFPNEDAKDINLYMERKVKPQIKEILEQYNPDLIWFDTPDMTPVHQSVALREMILAYNPQIIINSRIGNGKGDFANLEQKGSDKIIEGNWETCITMSKNWGYMKDDVNFKSSEKLIGILVDAVSKGGNLLLNVGPTPEGVFQQKSLDRLNDIGQWIKINKEAIYGTTPWIVYGENNDPEAYKAKVVKEAGFEDAVFDGTENIAQDIRFTTNGKELYVIARSWRNAVVNVKTLTASGYKIKKVTLLGYKKKVDWLQTNAGLSITIPEKEKKDIPVYVFKLDGVL